MRRIRLSLVGLPATAREVALTAAQVAFPGAEAVERFTLAEVAEGSTPVARELLVMGDADAGALSEATQALDDQGLPRWPVVVLGRDDSDLAETVPPEEWNPWLLARVFRAAVLQYELLRENLRMRGDLKTVARRFSHDLVTPVGCINTSACVLKILPPEDTQATAAIIQNIEDSSAEISQLIERMSYVVRASVDPGIPVELEMGAVVETVLTELEGQIKKTGATVALPPAWPKVTGVPKSLQVIWWNLVGNALKHGGASVRLELGWQAVGGGHQFFVSDNGPGPDPAMQHGLFRAFDLLHNYSTAGLGLSIVRRLTDLHGGRCAYENLPARGARFSFTVPGNNVSDGFSPASSS